MDNLPKMSSELIEKLVTTTGIMHLACKFGRKEIKPSQIRSKLQFLALLDGMGRDSSSAIEFHLERAPGIFAAIDKCLEVDSPDSAIVLLFTCIEGEVNTALRMIMRIKGFSKSEIESAIKGIDFSTKIEVILPLLGITVPPRVRQFSNESKIVRNKIVHFKATPNTSDDFSERTGDYFVTREDASSFFKRNPPARLKEDMINFVDFSISQLHEFQAAIRAFQRFTHWRAEEKNS